MRNLLSIIFILLLTGCQFLGGSNTTDRITGLLEADNTVEGEVQVVCVRGGIKGTFTQTDLSYVKKVYPEGEPAPDC